MATILAGAVALTAAALIARASMKALSNTRPSIIKPAWLPRQKFLPGGFQSEMTRNEAAQILSIRESASKDKIKSAHRGLMGLNHPDRMGSPYLAAKINEAKDLLSK